MTKISILSLCGILFLLFAQNQKADNFEKFIKAIHQVESSGRLGEIYGDNGRSYGPLQIGKLYYQDAKEFSKGKLKGSYSNVSDLTYAKKVVFYYLSRYESEALKSGDFEIMARAHNGGPNWRKKRHLTNRYWQKVKKQLE